jgi:threonine aldolase
VAGTKEFVARARRVRKLFGGHMRQVGILAAGAIYALDHHINRLVEDHQNAQLLAAAVRDTPGLRLDPDCVESNLVWFDVDPKLAPAPTIATRMREAGALVHVAGPRTLRVCTHLDVTSAQAVTAADLLRRICR